MCIVGLLSFILPGKWCILSPCGLNPCFIQRHLHQLQLLPEFAPVPRASGTAKELYHLYSSASSHTQD